MRFNPVLMLAIPLLLALMSAANTRAFELDELFASPSLTGTAPSAPKWSPDSARFVFTWNRAGVNGRRLWLADKTGGQLRPLTETGVSDFAWLDNSTVLMLREGVLWRVTVDSGELVKLADLGRGAGDLRLAPDGRHAAVLQSGDLQLVALDSGKVRSLTQLGIPGLSPLQRGRYSRREREIGPGIWGGPRYSWSPDSSTLAVHIVDRRQMRQVPFPNYLDQETVPNHVRRGYPGDSNEIRQVGLVDAASGNLKLIELPAPDATQVLGFSWSAAGALLIDTAADTAVDRNIYVLDPTDHEPQQVWHERRTSRMYTSFAADWHPDGERLLVLSDREDRYGLYVLDPGQPDQLPSRITDERFDVLSAPHVVAAADAVYFAGNGEGPASRHAYRFDTASGDTQRLSAQPGHHTIYPSPDGQHAVLRTHNDTTPPELWIAGSSGAPGRSVTDSTTAAFKARALPRVEYVSFASQIDDYTLHARIMTPANIEPGQRHPVLFGPVYSNTVRNQWRGVYSLMQQYLVDLGYIVVQVDVRGSTGYGRAFREAFLLDFAGDDLDDLASAVAYMEAQPYVDPDRIGIWGSSYGGTLSVYSLLKKPGLFQAAAAAAAAVDPDFFGTDDVAIVRRPDSHPAIFDRKAINFVDNLEDHLLLIHGMQDHVVPFKTTATLAEALIKAGKDFDFAFAPGATHSWAREPGYQRYLFGKLVDFFERHLGSAPAPQRDP